MNMRKILISPNDITMRPHETASGRTDQGSRKNENISGKGQL